MATIERIPSDPRRSETRKIEKQATQTYEIALLVGIAIIAILLAPGCKAGRSPVWQTSALAASYEPNRQVLSPDIDEEPHDDSVRLVSHQAADENSESQATLVIPLDSGTATSVDGDRDMVSAENSFEVSLDAVLDSVESCYPEIEVAIGEIESARGKVLASWGEFDSVFAAHSISQPLGFYETYRNGAGVSQPLFGGGEVYGTYRIGDGNFEPWFGERETNEGGEFKAGFSLPILKDRNIDRRRAKLRAAIANRDQVESDVESRLLQFQRFATQAYWDWVASGRAVEVQQRILELAKERVAQIDRRVEIGDLATLARIDNDRFIAKRTNDLIKARRSLEKSAIKLSLFFRSDDCQPIIAGADQIPVAFPEPNPISSESRDSDIANAIQVRPELIALAADRRKACVAYEYANNLLLPKLDMKGFAGQDIGADASSKGDKSPFELQVGLYAEVPLQRREAQGKIQAAEGKILQIDAKSRFITDKIRVELQDASSAVNAAFDQIQQSRQNFDLASRSLTLGRESFEAGDIDLIALNIYETSVADAALQLLDAQFKYFFYLAVYETANSGQAFDR